MTPADRVSLLHERLDAIARVLSRRGDAIALVAVGSVGEDVADRLDEHSDLDFFAVVEDEAKPSYLASIDWLEQAHEVAFDFVNTADGRKVLFTDGVYAEYAVFTLVELRAASYHRPRVVWTRPDAPADLGIPRRPVPALDTGADAAPFQLYEALTNLYIGLHRDARGERLSAMRLIQVHALDRMLDFLEITAALPGRRQDPFAPERGLERRLSVAREAASAGPSPLAPALLTQLAPGYERNREAAAAALRWWQEHAARLGGEACQPPPALVAAIEELLR